MLPLIDVLLGIMLPPLVAGVVVAAVLLDAGSDVLLVDDCVDDGDRVDE